MMPSIKCGCGVYYRVNQATLNRAGFFPRCSACRRFAAKDEANLCIAINVTRGKKRCKHLKTFSSEYCALHLRKLQMEEE